MTNPSLPPTESSSPDEHRFCIIVGAGISGIIHGAEILRKNILPYEDFEILDRYGGFGGVWWTNTYPGAACDVESHIYQVSWCRNPDWSQRYASQKEIQQYWDGIARDKFHLERSTTFNTNVDKAVWNENEMLWVLETTDTKTGQRKTWTCNVLITCVGFFSYPKKADISGIDGFKRPAWHTADWPADTDLKGKRVGIIGTGPSAAQIIPEIQKDVSFMVVFQRSTTHCLPRNNKNFSALTRWIFRNIPYALTAYALGIKWFNKAVLYRVFQEGSWLWNKVHALARKHITAQVKSEQLQQKLECKDPFGCKRPLVLDNYYSSLEAPNVELLTDPVIGLSETGIRFRSKETGQEEEREIDILIWGTGYKLAQNAFIFPIYGRGGVSVPNHLGLDGYSLYGVAIDEFPNLLTVFGPNSGSLWSHVVEIVEHQALYNIQVIKHLLDINRGSFRRAVMPRRDVIVNWVESLRPAQAKLPAADPNCVSYYKNAKGIVAMYPYETAKYLKLVRKPDFVTNYVMLSIRPGMKEARITNCD
ncbi:monooxygenase [Wilcoxina mikolae CBS 423.85]|nr:monooxygenase [Wilcoxina mikolae CBS 423.85]